MKRFFTILMMAAVVAVSCSKGGEEIPDGGEVTPPTPATPQTQFTSSQGAGGTVVMRFYTSSKPEGVEGAELTKSEIDNFDTVHTYTLTDSTFALLGEVERIVIEDETISAIDTSANSALKSLDCQDNSRLTALDLSANLNMTTLKAQNCALSSLIVSPQAQNLSSINIFNNRISGAAMAAFIESLPTTTFGQIYLSEGTSGNIATTSDIGVAIAKGWDVYYQGAWIDAKEFAMITFADSEVKRLCVENWDTNGDGELSQGEAAAVTTLADAFENNKNITQFDELQYFTGLKSISESAFNACENLAKVTLPNRLTSIGTAAFYDCHSLTTITIPDNVASISATAFSSCSKMEAFYGQFASKDNRYLSINGTLKAFAPAGITEYTIPSGIVAIDDKTFCNLKELTIVTIPKSVTSIGAAAFQACSNLKSVHCEATTPPAGGSLMFDGNAADRKIYVPAAALGAYKDAPYWKDYAKAIVDPNGNGRTDLIAFADSEVKRICVNRWDTDEDGEISFNEAAAVSEIDMIFAYSQITSFDEFKYFTDVRMLAEEAFTGCDNLKTITLPSGIITIGDCAFDSCENLESITLSDDLTYVGYSVFSSCYKLKKLYGKYATADNSCWIVGDTFVLAAPQALTTYTIPNSVTTIGDNAFSYCNSLTSVTIHKNVSHIGECAFYGSTDITSIYVKATTPPVLGGDDVFFLVSNQCKIYVPRASLNTYKNAKYWSEFADYIVGYDF